MNWYAIGFWFLSLITVASALLIVFSRNPLVSALYLALAFIGLSGLFVFLEAHFVALIQVLIYAGAIIILFIYVIMFLDLSPERIKGTYRLFVKIIGALLFTGLSFVFIFSFTQLSGGKFPPISGNYSSTVSLAESFFTHYVIPFELISIILTVGIIGAVILVKNIERKA